MAKLAAEPKTPEGKPSSEFDWKVMREFFLQLVSYYRLYLVIVAVLVPLALIVYAIAQPEYTAVAIVGPPNPSPISSLASSLSGGGSSTTSIARRLLGGQAGAGAANDPFQEYLQLLRSNRLATALVEKDNILPRVFFKRWDAKNNRWFAPGLLHDVVGVAKRLLHRPVKDHPDVDDLKTYLSDNFSVGEATARRSSILSSAGTGYMIATLNFPGREEAQNLLNIILRRADEIIREEQSRDVLARISFLEAELPSTTQTEQREALITTLIGQEEMKMMIKADQRFASILVDTPYASPVPTWPDSPATILIAILSLSAALWGVLVGLESRSKLVHRFIHRFRARGAETPARQDAAQKAGPTRVANSA